MPNEYQYLADEWKTSVELGVAQDIEKLPESARDMNVFERINDFDKYRLAYLNDYYNRRDEVLGELGAAIFYTSEDRAVFRKAGNPELLSELREKGMRLGTKLSMENVGSCAANVNLIEDQVTCRMGSENFLEIFSDYGFFVYPWNELVRKKSGILIAVCPVEKCNYFVQNAIDFLISVEGVTHEIYYPFTRKRANLLEASINNSDSLEFFLDEHGDVIFASRAFQILFNKKIKNGLPPGINHYLPELSYLTRFFDTNRNPCQTREVLLLTAEKKNDFFLAVPEIILSSDGTKGLRCVLQHSGKRKYIANRETSSGGSELKYNFGSIIGESEKMHQLKEYAAKIAKRNSNVLILGESGTGKELFAQAIHSASPNSKGPFVPINCASLPKELLNSELFGYEEGAFTGALKGGAPGKFEQANGGTIFLDEIGDMPLDMQSALLRVLEDKTVIRVGGRKYIPVDVRVIAATNKDIWQSVQNGTFRADLYFRLNVVTINVPPLRDRKDDIPVISEHLLNKFCAEFRGERRELSLDMMNLLQGYYWPGNVRELSNILERCLNYTSERHIRPDCLPADIIKTLNNKKVVTEQLGQYDDNLGVADWQGYNREKIIYLMKKHAGNKSKVAKELGISRATLYKRLREYDIGY